VKQLGNGGGIILSSGSNNTAYNNIIWNSKGGGINVSYRSVRSTIYHNTIYRTDDFGITIENPGGLVSGSIVQNNIVFGNIGPIRNGTNSNGPDTTALLDHNLIIDPLYKNPSMTPPDFHLQSGSPAIAAGMTISSIPADLDGVSRPQGAYDIGAYQHAGSFPAPQNLRIRAVSP
jgi:hypothetical protein